MDNQVPNTPFLAAYHKLFNSDDLWSAARKLGAVSRERKVDLPALVEASVMALSGLPGTQTTIYAHYVELTGQTLAPSAFYDRFTQPYAQLWRCARGRLQLPGAAQTGGGMGPFDEQGAPR